MNEIRRAGLNQIGVTLEALLGQVTSLLEAERVDVQDLPDNIENSEFATQFLKRPLMELSMARIMLLECVEHISAAILKEEK